MLVLLPTMIFAVIIVLRSRRLGLPLLITLNGIAFIPFIQPLASSINNFWGANFVTGIGGLGALALIPLVLGIGPMTVSGFVIWNLASSRRDAFFSTWAPDPFLMRSLKIFSSIFFALYLFTLLQMLAVVPGLREAIRAISKLLAFPTLALMIVNMVIGPGLICFLWYAIGRTQGEHAAIESYEDAAEQS